MTEDPRLVWKSPEVLYSDGGFRAVDDAMVDLLKSRAALSPRRRCRLCFHADPQAAQQEMLIVMHRESYVRPHRHFDKIETLGIIEGRAETLLFAEDGRLAERIAMSAPGGGGAFFYRMPKGIFHTLRFQSEWLVFVETTIGPFDPAASEGAPFAPPESEPEAGRLYLEALPVA